LDTSIKESLSEAEFISKEIRYFRGLLTMERIQRVK